MQTVAVLEASEIEALKKIAQNLPSLVEKMNDLLSSSTSRTRSGPIEWLTQKEMMDALKISESHLINLRDRPDFPYAYEKLAEQTVRYRFKEPHERGSHSQESQR